MTQNKIQMLTYLNYFKETFGVHYFQDFKVKHEVKIKTGSGDKTYWKNANDFVENIENNAKTNQLKTVRNVFIVQNNWDQGLVSLFHPDNWNIFRNMVKSLDLDFNEIAVWETNEQELQEVFHFLLSFSNLESIFLMLTNPAMGKKVYSFQRAKVLETYSPLLFCKNLDLKRLVWNDFKLFKAKN